MLQINQIDCFFVTLKVTIPPHANFHLTMKRSSRNGSKDLLLRPSKTETKTRKATKQRNAEKSVTVEPEDKQLIEELKQVNNELINHLREQYPKRADQEYLGIYEDPKKKRKRED